MPSLPIARHQREWTDLVNELEVVRAAMTALRVETRRSGSGGPDRRWKLERLLEPHDLPVSSAVLTAQSFELLANVTNQARSWSSV
jgi:hypothetical protein